MVLFQERIWIQGDKLWLIGDDGVALTPGHRRSRGGRMGKGKAEAGIGQGFRREGIELDLIDFSLQGDGFEVIGHVVDFPDGGKPAEHTAEHGKQAEDGHCGSPQKT